MSATPVRIYIESIEVKSNGDLPNEQAREKENALIAELIYPRAGVSSVVTTKKLALESEKKMEFDPDDFWEAGLFKETIDGEAILKITLTDRDQPSTFDRIFSKLFATVFGAGIGAVTAGVSNVIMGAVLKLGTTTWGESLKVEKESIDIIGKAETKLDAEALPDALELTLKAAKTIKVTALELPPVGGETGKPVRKEVELTRKNRSNGTIKLRFVTPPVA